MPNIVNVEYKQTGQSKSTNPLGMGEMQERAFECRDEQYLLIKSPHTTTLQLYSLQTS